MSSDPLAALGAYLTVREATGLAVLLGSGQHISTALKEVGTTRKAEAKDLLDAAGIDHTDVARSLAILQAIIGAKSLQRELTPVWTMPGNEASFGHLTSEYHRLVQAARQSVTCATYNFEPTSQMWNVLQDASEQPGVVVTVYVDGEKADGARVKAQLPKATIYQSSALPNGKRVISHAKFIVIDHAMLLVTSANFSFSGENRNIEFGLRVQDGVLAESVEAMMFSKHGSLYELV